MSSTKRALVGTYILLTASILLLALTLLIIRAWSVRGSTEPVAAVETPPAYEETRTTSTTTATRKKTETAVKPSPRVAIIIDDVGNSLDELKPYLELPMPITFAVMPQREYSRESVEQIQAAGQFYIMHQPMQPVGDQDPGAGAILVGMDREEVRETMERNLASLGGAPGINNHMGSKVTADPETMEYVLGYLKEQGMFFLDSLTIGNSVGAEVAEALQLPYAVRNSMFLDNNRERDYVERALRSGFDIAANTGRAVMIGHVWDETLANLLLELYPEFDQAGFTFDDIGSMIYLGQQGVE